MFVRLLKLLFFVVPAELLAHRGEEPVGIARFAPRCEAPEERRADHGRRYALLDGGTVLYYVEK